VTVCHGCGRSRQRCECLEIQLLSQVRLVGLPEPTREHRFHETRRWRFDFAWPDRMIALEVDGGTWSGGRHTRPGGYERDAEKLNTAATRGWRVLRVTSAMVKDGRALAVLEEILSDDVTVT
jgi:very-short-patch-repair endonuclease